jgi:hypothetical protein
MHDDERKRSTMNPEPTGRGDIAWGRALLAGAVLGGIGSGLFAAATIGAAGDQAHFEAIIGPRMLVAAVVSVTCLIAAATLAALTRSGIKASPRVLRSTALALIIAAASGWIVLGLAMFQTFIGVW